MNNSEDQIISQTVIELTFKIIINEREIIQNQYITDRYAYIENGGKKALFLPKKKKQYLIDTEIEQLKEIDLSAQTMQVNQIKSMIGEINATIINDTTSCNGNFKQFHLSNTDTYPVKFNAEIHVSEYPGLEKTIYHEFNAFQADLQLFKIDLKSNEIVSYLESVLTINGMEQKSIIELVSIITKTKTINEIDTYLGWVEKT